MNHSFLNYRQLFIYIRCYISSPSLIANLNTIVFADRPRTVSVIPLDDNSVHLPRPKYPFSGIFNNPSLF